jgi:predicted nuclease with TOPRIM domain
MSEDLTRNLPNTFQERVLAELGAIRQENAQLSARMISFEDRLTSVENRLISMEDRVLSIDARLISLEDKVDARLRETRPVWEGVLQRLTEIETGLSTLNRQFKTMIREAFDLRSRVDKLEDSQPMP